MMDGSEFSVIVQGPIHSSPERRGSRDITIRSLASIRQFFPGAEIVLSTWNGADTDGLDYDILVKNEDPGAVAFNDAMPELGLNNVNRQIVSTKAGMAAATRPLAIKFRGDLFFLSAGLLNQSEALQRLPPGRLFHSRVLICPHVTCDPRKRYPFAFHYSDILQVGRTEDLRKLWSIPLAPEPETTRWQETHPGSRFFPVSRKFKMRLHPEQYLILAFLSTVGINFHFNHPFDISWKKILVSEKVLIENFRILELDQLGVVLPRRIIDLKSPPEAYLYQASDWERLSRFYAKCPARWLAQGDLLIMTAASFARRAVFWLFREGWPRFRGRFRKTKPSSPVTRPRN